MSANSIRVLLIEDDQGDVDLARQLLLEDKSITFALECVERVGFALERLKKENFDVILTDLSLPDSEGLETFKRVYAQVPEIPIVVLTGTYQDEQLALLALQNGAQDYLEKGEMKGKMLSRVIRYAIERKRAEEARSLLVHLVESSNDAIIGITLGGVVLSWNRGAERIFGYSFAETKGQSDLLLVPPELVEEKLKLIERVKQGESVEHFETVRLRKDGQRINVSLSLSPIRIAGRITGISIISRDISRRKQNEETLAQQRKELERSNSELWQFAHVASHDLKEPLRMVRSYTQLLEKRYRGKFDKDADEFIQFIVEGVSRMHDLISDLLTYSALGKEGRTFKMIDCEEVLKQTLHNLQVAIKESNVVITHDPLPLLIGDSIELVQLFQNLIGNAVKFHGQRPLLIHVGVKEDESEWIISIRDNGIGIDPEHFDRIFVIFQRLHHRSEYPGTGIGLTICKKIIERHGGRIWVESQLGEGSTFYLTFPRLPAIKK